MMLLLALSLERESVLFCVDYPLASNFVRNISRHKTLAFLALIIWLTASLSGAHGHLCFDGQEPPISIHMEMLGEHIEHDSSMQHVGADIDIGEPALAKLIKMDLPLIIAAAMLLALLFKTRIAFITLYRTFCLHRVTGIRPPLRAPPVLPV